MCRASYRRLPPSLASGDSGLRRAQRGAADAAAALGASPAGPLLRSFASSAYLYASINSAVHAAIQVVAVPRMLAAARTDPLRALRPLAPRFAAAVVLEPLITSAHDFRFHAETVAFYAVGWGFDAAARGVEAVLAPAAAGMPWVAQAALAAALWVPKGVGIALQALDLTLMAIYGGGMAGFLQGSLETAAAPFKALAFAAKCGAGALGLLAAALAHGGASAGAAARLIRRGGPAPG